MSSTFWYLAEIDEKHGTPKLADGPHDSEHGVKQALYLFNSLGLSKSRKFATAEVRLTECIPSANGVNQGAIATLNSIGLKP